MKELTEIINTLTREVGIHLSQAISIFESFFSGYAEAERLLEICVKHKDFNAISKHAHQLKGTAANLRMSHISDCATLIETAAKESDMGRCKDYISNITEYIDSLKSQMELYQKIQRLKILIVEDNIASGKILEQTIINLGHNSLGIVSSPEQVLLSVKKELPDAVFMDIDLSGEMNGIYTAELLSCYYSIPVIFVSVHAESTIIKNAQQYGIGYVVKPFTQKEIEEMIGLISKNIMDMQASKKPEPTKLKVKDDNQIFFIDFYDVICFEAKGHNILIYTDYKVFESRMGLKDIKTMDVNGCFIQPHRSYLVNSVYVEEIINENYNYRLRLRFIPNLLPVSKKNVKAIKNVFM